MEVCAEVGLQRVCHREMLRSRCPKLREGCGDLRFAEIAMEKSAEKVERGVRV